MGEGSGLEVPGPGERLLPGCECVERRGGGIWGGTRTPPSPSLSLRVEWNGVKKAPGAGFTKGPAQVLVIFLKSSSGFTKGPAQVLVIFLKSSSGFTKGPARVFVVFSKVALVSPRARRSGGAGCPR